MHMKQTLRLTLVLLSLMPSAAQGSEAQQRLLALREDVRRLTFQMILASAGESCDSVARTYYQGNTQYSAVWNVDCGGKAYAIYIDPHGNTKLIDCRVRAALEGRSCFEPLPAPE
jgi:hypothetical protein